tara:strand:- start:602 stop:784 length:183 start_codon:yes stop_codon:yes gene_type:complete
MTIERAIEMLKQTKDVEQWNTTRDHIKTQLSTDEWFKGYQYIIDASGLIVQVLGPDEHKN